jgi:hypothetical protein
MDPFRTDDAMVSQFRHMSFAFILWGNALTSLELSSSLRSGDSSTGSLFEVHPEKYVS